MSKGTVISLTNNFQKLTFLEDRTPDTTASESEGYFAELSDYRNGAIFIAHYAGSSDWERHGEGDEIVSVIDGETNLVLLDKDGEKANHMRAGDIIVVPQGQWHRFESPKGVKVMSVTPQPTDHSFDTPTDI